MYTPFSSTIVLTTMLGLDIVNNQAPAIFQLTAINRVGRKHVLDAIEVQVTATGAHPDLVAITIHRSRIHRYETNKENEYR